VVLGHIERIKKELIWEYRTGGLWLKRILLPTL
jgi:hypothetical protein